MLQCIWIHLKGLLLIEGVNSTSQFLWWTNGLVVNSTPASRLLTHTLNKSGPRTDPWGALLVSSPQPDCHAIHYNPFSSALHPVLHQEQRELTHPTAGQLIHRDAVRDSIKGYWKIHKKLHPAPSHHPLGRWPKDSNCECSYVQLYKSVPYKLNVVI